MTQSEGGARRVRVAGFPRRAAATMLDLLLLGGLDMAVGVVLLALAQSRAPRVRELGLDLLLELALHGGAFGRLCLAAMVALGLGYFAWCHTLGGQTVGKRLLRIRVIDRYGEPPDLRRSLLRAAASLLSTVVFSLGYLWIAFDREKRSLHDWLTGTYVVHVS